MLVYYRRLLLASRNKIRTSIMHRQTYFLPLIAEKKGIVVDRCNSPSANKKTAKLGASVTVFYLSKLHVALQPVARWYQTCLVLFCPGRGQVS